MPQCRRSSPTRRLTLATIYDAAAFMGPAYWIPAFWVPALPVITGANSGIGPRLHQTDPASVRRSSAAAKSTNARTRDDSNRA